MQRKNRKVLVIKYLRLTFPVINFARSLTCLIKIGTLNERIPTFCEKELFNVTATVHSDIYPHRANPRMPVVLRVYLPGKSHRTICRYTE